MKTLNENSNVKVEGHVVITDADSGEVLLDKYNAINFQNFAFAVAQAMSGGTTYAVNKLAFGYGGTSIDSGTGAITEAGIFNASSSGTMLCRTVFSVVNKGASDSMTITWTVTVS